MPKPRWRVRNLMFAVAAIALLINPLFQIYRSRFLQHGNIGFFEKEHHILIAIVLAGVAAPILLRKAFRRSEDPLV